MPLNRVSPAELEREALRRWYLRTPADIEEERQAEAARRYQSFFGRPRPHDPDPGFGRAFPGPDRDPDPGFAPDVGSTRDVDPGFSWIPVSESRWRAARVSGGALRSPSTTYDPGSRLNGSSGLPTAGRAMQPLSSRAQTPASTAGGSQAVPTTDRKRHAIWVAGRQPNEIDPSRTDVFKTGPDGKLHAIPGWRTTGPFDFADWSKMFDWGGVGGDLADITSGALDFMGGGGLAGEVLKGLRYKVGQDVVRGIIHAHHSWPKFMGGPSKQDLARLYESLHVDFHAELAEALKKSGFPRVGGKGGGAKDWSQYFSENAGKADEAMETLRRTTRDFDRRNGTNISKYLDQTLSGSKPPTSPPSR